MTSSASDSLACIISAYSLIFTMSGNLTFANLVAYSCLTGIYFGGSKTEKNGLLRISFFPVFSEGFFHRNMVLEGVTGIPVFCHCHRIFLKEFLRDKNSCIYSEFLRIPPDSFGFLRIPLDSSGFLRIPVPAKHCLALASN